MNESNICSISNIKNLNQEKLPERNKRLYGTSEGYKTGCGKITIILNEKNNKPYEMIVKNSGLSCYGATEGLSILISTVFQISQHQEDLLEDLTFNIKNTFSEEQSDKMLKLLKELSSFFKSENIIKIMTEQLKGVKCFNCFKSYEINCVEAMLDKIKNFK